MPSNDKTIEFLLRIRDEASQALKDLGKEAGKTEEETKKASGAMDDMTKSILKAGVISDAYRMALGLLKQAFMGVSVGAIEVGAQMERFETQLQTLMGPTGDAAARLERLFEIGSTTPFELDGLVEAEINLRALGVNAEETLPLVMDFAGAMGVDLASAAVEVGRAMQFGAGAVETISGRALRAQVELRTGADALKMSTEEFREELIATLTDSNGIFAGGTQKLAATFGGMMSNLSDSWFKFQKQVADAGLFDAAQDTLVLILDTLGDNAEVTQQWAEVIASGLTGAMLLFAEALVKVGQVILVPFSAIQKVVLEITKMVNSLPDFVKAQTGLGLFFASDAAAEDAFQLVIDTGAALARADEDIDNIQANLSNMGTGGPIGPTSGKATDVGSVVDVEGTASKPIVTESPTVSDALSQIVSNTASLADGTIPGGAWWAEAINFLAQIGDTEYDLNWSLLGETVHDAFVGAIRLTLSVEEMQRLVRLAIFDGFVDAMRLLFSGSDSGFASSSKEAGTSLVSRSVNEWLSNQGVPGFQTGTKFVDRTSLALLHQGEQVVPANGARPNSGGGFGGGGGLVVNVNAPLGIGPGTAEQLVRELNAILGARGLNLSVT